MDKNKRKKKHGQRKWAFIALMPCLLAMVLTGCGNSKEAAGVSEESSDFSKTVESDDNKVADIAMLAEMLKSAAEIILRL